MHNISNTKLEVGIFAGAYIKRLQRNLTITHQLEATMKLTSSFVAWNILLQCVIWLKKLLTIIRKKMTTN